MGRRDRLARRQSQHRALRPARVRRTSWRPSPIRDELSLESLAAEAGEILTGIDTPVIVVGQSLGTQIAELVAAEHAEQVDGLVLLTPVPLAARGYPTMRSHRFALSRDDLQAQRAARSPTLAGTHRARSSIGSPEPEHRTLPDVVARYVDIWNDGISQRAGHQ